MSDEKSFSYPVLSANTVGKFECCTCKTVVPRIKSIGLSFAGFGDFDPLGTRFCTDDCAAKYIEKHNLTGWDMSKEDYWEMITNKVDTIYQN